MSKIGKMPIAIKEGVTVTIENGVIAVNGAKGALSFPIPQGILVTVADGNAVVSQKPETALQTKALFGLTRAIINNMVKGVSDGFEKKLELTGVGYRAQMMGNDVSLSVGFSHPVKIKAPEGIKFVVADNAIIVSGSDKTIVGDIAAKIRAIRPPEPYKGKGIKYSGEKIRRKAGKAAKAVGAK